MVTYLIEHTYTAFSLGRRNLSEECRDDDRCHSAADAYDKSACEISVVFSPVDAEILLTGQQQG